MKTQTGAAPGADAERGADPCEQYDAQDCKPPVTTAKYRGTLAFVLLHG